MKNIVNHKEIDMRIWNVHFDVVPQENRPDPNKLAPKVRDVYNRLVEAGYSDFIRASETGENFFVSGTFNCLHKSGDIDIESGDIDIESKGIKKTPFKAYNSFAADMLDMFNSSYNPQKEGIIRALKNKYSEKLVIISPPKEMEYQSSLSFSL